MDMILKRIGNLLKNDIWVKGFNLFCEFNINCDLQINPNQFLDTYDLIKNKRRTNFIINHVGLPLYKDVNDCEYWTGLNENPSKKPTAETIFKNVLYMIKIGFLEEKQITRIGIKRLERDIEGIPSSITIKRKGEKKKTVN